MESIAGEEDKALLVFMRERYILTQIIFLIETAQTYFSPEGEPNPNTSIREFQYMKSLCENALFHSEKAVLLEDR